VIDVGANYWSLWNFHQISAKNLTSYYQAYPAAFDRINRRIGYRVRPSFIWSYKDDGYLGLIAGFANDGIAGVPDALRVTVESQDGKLLNSGCLDSGYPLPGKIRQAQFVLSSLGCCCATVRTLLRSPTGDAATPPAFSQLPRWLASCCSSVQVQLVSGLSA